MSFLEDASKGPVSAVLLGLGVVMVAPNVLPALATGLRPLAKALVRGGITLYDAAREGIEETGEQLNDLVEVTRAEMNQQTNDGVEKSEDENAGTTRRPRRRRSKS